MTGSAAPETPGWRPEAPVMALCALIITALWWLQVNPYLNAANDSGRYMVLAESLARSGELRLLNLPRPLPDTLYPPGFPAIIAFWLLATGRQPPDIVLLVKATQLVLLLLCVPLFFRLYTAAGLDGWWRRGAMLATAICPAFIAYANDVMSEIPFLALCLVCCSLLESRTVSADGEETMPAWQRAAVLASASAAYFVRTAAVALLVTLVWWYWKRFGRAWGAIALCVLLFTMGAWQYRLHRIVAHAPADVHYDSYMRQFSLKDPMNPTAGRLRMPIGILSRIKSGFPAYVGMLPRAIVNSMSVGSGWFVLFYLVAVPLCLLMIVGCVAAWRRGMRFSAAFAVLYWVMTAMWPWRAARFLVPIAPLLLTFAAIGLQWLTLNLARRVGQRAASGTAAAAFCVFAVYCLHVEAATAAEEGRPLAAGYSLGRDTAEGGFYAACAWLRDHGSRKSVVMGRPAYLVHLYSGMRTTQIEPSSRPRAQELAYMRPLHVRYILEDRWGWAHTASYIGPYLAAYGADWRAVFEDARSRVKVWERVGNTPTPANLRPAGQIPGAAPAPSPVSPVLQ